MRVVSVGTTEFTCPSCKSVLEVSSADLTSIKVCSDSGSYCESASYRTVYDAFRCPVCKACFEKSRGSFVRVTEY
jgi:hypothetical protein